jgi:hypothetical protein
MSLSRLEEDLSKLVRSFPKGLDVKTLTLFTTDFLAQRS